MADAAASDLASCAQSAVTEPVIAALHHCFPTDALVLSRYRGPVQVSDLTVDDELKSLMQARVRSVSVKQPRDRCFVKISFGNGQGSLTVTSSHVLKARRPSREHRYAAVLASDLQVGDWLRTLPGHVEVDDIDIEDMHASVIEVELEDSQATMYASSGGEFVEVYGALTPTLRDDTIKILTFNRHDNFREALLQSSDLEGFRRALETCGFDADLSTNGLGLGKMFVPAEIAWPTLLALYTRKHHTKRGATCSTQVGIHQVVVSRATESAVREAIRAHSRSRSIYVASEEVLPLPSVRLQTDGSRASVTCSTNPGANPRVHMPSAWDSYC